MLVALTCPAIGAAEVSQSSFPGEENFDCDLVEKIRLKMQEGREEGDSGEKSSPTNGEVLQSGFLAVLEGLTASQRLIVYAACDVLCPTFSAVMTELILILPPMHAPPPPPEEPALAAVGDTSGCLSESAESSSEQIQVQPSLGEEAAFSLSDGKGDSEVAE